MTSFGPGGQPTDYHLQEPCLKSEAHYAALLTCRYIDLEYSWVVYLIVTPVLQTIGVPPLDFLVYGQIFCDL